MFSKGISYSICFQLLALAIFAVFGSLSFPSPTHAAALSTTNESNATGTTCAGSYIGSLSSIDTTQLPSNYNTPGAYCIQTTTTTTTNCNGTSPSSVVVYGLYSTGAITSNPNSSVNSCVQNGPGGGCTGRSCIQALRVAPFTGDLASVYTAFQASPQIALSSGSITNYSYSTITYLAPTVSSLTAPTQSVTFVDSLPSYTTVWGYPGYFSMSPGVSGLQVTYGVSVLNGTTQVPIAEGSSIPVGTPLILQFIPFSSDALSVYATYLGGFTLGGDTVAPINNSQSGSWITGSQSAASCIPSEHIAQETIYPFCVGGPLGNTCGGYQPNKYVDIYATFAVQPPSQSLTNLAGLSCGAIVNGQATCTETAAGTLTPTFSFAQTTAEFYENASSTPNQDANGNNISGQCGGSGALDWEGTNSSPTTIYSAWTTIGIPFPVNAVNITYPLTILASNLTAGSVSPASAAAGVSSTFSSTVTNSGPEGTVSGFTDLFEEATDSSGTGATAIGTSTSSALAANAHNTASLSYTFPGGGTFYLRACANEAYMGDTGTVVVSDPNGECGPWTQVTVSPLSPTATLSAQPGSVPIGGSATLSWSSTNAFACSGTNFSTGGATGNPTPGSVSVSPSTDTTYTVTCTNSVGATTTASAIVDVTYPDLTAGATSFSTKRPDTNTNVSLSASVSNIGAANASNFPNMFQIATDSGFNNTVALVNASTIGLLASNASLPISTSYTFPSAGTFYVRACANFNNTWGGSIPESNNTNNCGAGSSITVTQGTPPPLPDLTAGTVVLSPSPANVSQNVSFSANVSNIGTAAASNFPNMFQIATDSGFVNTVAIVNGTTIGSLGINASTPISGSYTFSSAGTFYVRACANFNNTWGGSIPESNTNNNCGTAQSVSVLNPTVVLSADPSTPILLNSSVTLTWSSQNAVSCTGNNFSTPGNPISGSVVVTPLVTTTYIITCNNGGQTAGSSSAVVTVIPADLTLTANPTTVRKGNPTTLTWGVTGQASACSLSGSGLQNGSISVGLSGSQAVTVNNNSTYTLSCLAGGVSATQTVTVGLVPNYIEF